ncbi:4-amino-4-deoxy-L-arabinose-phosphoundecaprenol flippase subunit ArnF [Dongshaea marina]|uniref:4-amino-4-deoxy-L-arabinose-phosphoundecaprenol flippase subunit ArnF n=1 Tax=Dongshaea marina TaxID=2047966 RepID=UPI000D3E1FAB|nr:4-amino-4-deoxy-L-arabinose-phosphoundecaprenol flippase subunit ArnF [Dongshaea marina]
MRSWLAIAASVILVTIAQLIMKQGMTELPPLSSQLLAISELKAHWQAILLVCIGLGCYALSLGCWMLALVRLPLSLAYPCLSISYILVTLFASLLFDEPFSIAAVFGSCLILLGVTLITYKPAKKAGG